MTETKCFNVKMPAELWVYLKKNSVDRVKPMNGIVVELLEKYKRKNEKALTD